jgi:hypothetical protein
MNNQDELTKALLALPKGENKPLCWDMDVLVGFIHDRELRAREDELRTMYKKLGIYGPHYATTAGFLTDLIGERISELHAAKEGDGSAEND